MASSSEDLNQEIYDSAVEARYHRFTSRIKSFRVNDSLDQFVFNAVSAIADIIPTMAKDALPIDQLAKILSYFSQVDELIRIPNFRVTLGLTVTILTHQLKMHGLIPHPETILDPHEFTDKETKTVRDRSGILLRHL